jgi:hypothetical protein
MTAHKVDNREPAKSEAEWASDMIALIIGTPV